MSPRERTLSGALRRISRATAAAFAPPAESPTAQMRAWPFATPSTEECVFAAASFVRGAEAPELPHPSAAAATPAIRSGWSRETISRPLPVRRLFELSDLEDHGPTVGACALNRWATVLHGHLLRGLDLDLLLLLDAITLGHSATS